MKECRKIELLAPAKNVETGMEAIRHGADAVYIGAEKYGARAAAGNSLEDLALLVDYAHLYRVRVYVTVNTILKDEELPDVEQLIWKLYRLGVDALIVQDLALLKMNLPPIPLHASTQMDNRSAEKVRYLYEMGYRQAVLARELTLDEISKIHAAVPQMPLEVFIHGALCVSYSGQCYASQACFGRSANRGECAQFCRLPFDLVDAKGRVISRNKYPLSLKDMNQSDNLEQLLDAGVTSLKIEGRLKDNSYVKNVTAYYRKKLDAIFSRRTEYERSSSGHSILSFSPQLDKSFNRGFTDYFLHGRNGDICSLNTPKSLGEEMGYVKESRGGFIVVAGTKHFNNGDGVCFIDEMGELHGFRINKVEQNRLFPQERVNIRPHTVLYRNYDHEFERLLSRPSAQRKLKVDIVFREIPDGFLLGLTDENGNRVALPIRMEKQLAHSEQRENLKKQLVKLGNTPFEADDIEIQFSQNYFIPSSHLAEARRIAVNKLVQVRKITYRQEVARVSSLHTGYYQGQNLTYLANAMNRFSVEVYKEQGASEVEPAFDKEGVKGGALMNCRHCIRFMMGWCPVHQRNKSPFTEPYSLVSRDGRRFRLDFDCKQCQMKVYAAE